MSNIAELGRRLADLDAKATPGPWCARLLIECTEHDSDLCDTLRNAMPTLLRALAVMEATQDFDRNYGRDDIYHSPSEIKRGIARRADELLDEWKRS